LRRAGEEGDVPDDAQHSLRAIALDPDVLSSRFEVQTKWQVIAGAQSSGKTTLIGQLAEQGYRVAPEGARLYLEGEMARGRTADEIRRNIAAFQRGIAETQLGIERDLRAAEIVFLDRAVPDCLAWWRVYGLNPNELLGKCFRHRYASVFILDRLPIQRDGLRPEDEALAVFIDEWTRRDYDALGYSVVRVPVSPPQERLAFVLERLGEGGSTRS
jgi:predicted ATPase